MRSLTRTQPISRKIAVERFVLIIYTWRPPGNICWTNQWPTFSRGLKPFWLLHDLFCVANFTFIVVLRLTMLSCWGINISEVCSKSTVKAAVCTDHFTIFSKWFEIPLFKRPLHPPTLKKEEKDPVLNMGIRQNLELPGRWQGNYPWQKPSNPQLSDPKLSDQPGQGKKQFPGVRNLYNLERKVTFGGMDQSLTAPQLRPCPPAAAQQRH